LVENLKGKTRKRPLCDLLINGFLDKIRCKDVGWIQLVQDRVQFLNVVLNLWILKKQGIS
jgi:hypothetical protein